MKESQAVSGSVAGLPSVSALRIAVTGRQLWNVYFASQAQMAPSAMARFNKANSRAFCSSVLPRTSAIICAILFQWPGGVSVPAASAQNKAINVWSSVRDEFTPHDTCDLLGPIGDSSENRDMKRIEAGCGSRKQIDERLVRRGAGSCFTRSAGRHCALHQVRFVRAGDAVDRIVD